LVLLLAACNALSDASILIKPLTHSVTYRDVLPAFTIICLYLARLLFQFETPASSPSVFACYSK